MKTVFKVKVIARDVISDFYAKFKNITGGRIKTYEKLIQDALEEAYNELKTEYPNIKNIMVGTTHMLENVAELIVYGEVEDGTNRKEK